MVLNPTALWGSAALVGLAAALWRQLRTVGRRLLSLAIVRVRIEDGCSPLALAVLGQLWKRTPPTRRGDREYRGYFEHIRSLGMNRLIALEIIGRDPMVFWRGWWPILVTLGPQSRENQNKELVLTFVRGTINPDQFVIDAVRESEQDYVPNAPTFNKKSARFRIKRYVGRGSGHVFMGEDSGRIEGRPVESISSTPDLTIYSARPLNYAQDDIGPALPHAANALDNLALSDEALAALDDVRRWHASREWYAERDIPWRYGLLLYGSPGNGKTATVGALARDLDMPIGSFDLASMGNDEFLKHWESFLSQAPAIALFEDIDAVFDGRRNVAGEHGGGLSFDCLLNALGGVQDAQGILVVVTTNRPETLDPALASVGDDDGMTSRPGRIDRTVCLNSPDEVGRRRIADRILCDCPSEIEAVVDAGDGDSGAQFQDRCRRVALARYWEPSRRNGHGVFQPPRAEFQAIEVRS